MRTIAHENLSAPEPLTPLNAGEAVWYFRCNLTNRRVADGSVVERCQTVQVVFDDDEARTPHVVGFGVAGEVSAADVQAVRDSLGGE